MDPEDLTQQPPNRQIDLVNDTFLERLSKGERPAVGDFAKRVSAELRSRALRELLITEREFLSKQRRFFHANPSTDSAESATRTGVEETSRFPVKIPAAIGSYAVQYVLGRGSSGVVYAAYEPKDTSLVAIKVPHAHQTACEDSNRRFLREARNAERMTHPKIVRFLKAGQSDDGPFLVYEMLFGIDLRGYLRNGPALTLEQKLWLIVDVARALQYAHDQGVVHRDLKPANVMVLLHEENETAEPDKPMRLSIKILDFGIGRLLDSATLLTKEGETLGTPAYMSPEQSAGQSSTADHRSDIYSLGTLFYELLSGRTPFAGSPAEIIDRIGREEVPNLAVPKLPKPVATICHRCLMLSPASRYARASKVADDIERFLAGDAILAKPKSLWERWSSNWRSQRVNTLAVAGSFILLFFAITLVWFNQRSNGTYRPPSPPFAIFPQSDLSLWMSGLPKSLESPDSLLNSLIRATPTDLIPFVDPLSPYHSDFVLLLDNALRGQDSKKRSNSDFEAHVAISCLLEPQRLDDPTKQTSLIHWIETNINESNSGDWLGLVKPIVSRIDAQLVACYRAEGIAPKRKGLCQLLAALHGRDKTRLIVFIDSAQPDELTTWSGALRLNDDFDITKDLCLDRNVLRSEDGNLVYTEQTCRAEANRVLLRLAHGDKDCFLKALADSPDPRLRTYVVHQFREAGLSTNLLLELDRNELTADVLYGVMIALAESDSGKMDAKLFRQYQEWVQSAYRIHPDAGIHCMCGLMLEQWGQREFRKSADQQLIAEGLLPDKHWFMNAIGMPMVIIQCPAEFWMGLPKGVLSKSAFANGHIERIEKSYAIGMEEVSNGQYRLYREAHNRTEPSDAPIANVTLSDGLGFCNWLNRKEQRNEFESSIADNVEVTPGYIDSYAGYRLPFLAEWEFASRAGTATSRFFGEKETLFSEAYSANEVSRVAKVFPNRWGVRNSLGSMAERTLTRFSRGEIPNEQTSTLQILYNAGGFMQDKLSQSNALPGISQAATPGPAIGIRLILSGLH